ncbi:MAG: hypothetical protein IJP28_01225 [Erysipelotrichales bacterium]|nr:hypothetical protein [Erysipelotrichales bacterium]
MLLLLSETVRNMLFLLPILSISSLESLYDLIPYADYSFIGRALYSMVSLSELDLGIFLQKLVYAFSASTVLCIVLSLYFMFTSYSTKIIRVARRISVINLFINLTTYGGAIVFILQALGLTTYEIALQQVGLVSMWGFVMHGVSVIVVLVGLYSVIRALVDALDYRAVEIEE